MSSSADTPPSTPAPSKKRPVEEGLCPEDSPHRKKSRQSEPELFTSTIRKQRQLFCEYHDENSSNNSSASSTNGTIYGHDHGDDEVVNMNIPSGTAAIDTSNGNGNGNGNANNHDHASSRTSGAAAAKKRAPLKFDHFDDDDDDDSSDSDDDEVIITGTSTSSSSTRTSTTNTNTCTTNATNRAFKTSKYDLSDDSDDEDVTFQGSTNNNLSASSAGPTTGTNITENYIGTVNIGTPRSNNNDDDDDDDVNDWCLDTTGYTNSQAIPIDDDDDDDDDDIDMEQKDDNDLFIPSVMDTPAPSTTYTGNRASHVSFVTPDISPTKPSSTSPTSSTSFSSSASNRGGRARQFKSSKFTSTTGVTLASSSSSSKFAPSTSSSNIHQLQAQAQPVVSVAAVASATKMVPVDRDIGYYIANHPITTFTVATNDDGKAYDATLNYCNITNHRNNNKYYKMQIVKKIGQEEYYVWFKWGRVGDSATGQQLKGPFASKQDASSAFSKKFRAKSGNTFGALHFTPKADKYKLLDMQYDNLGNVGRGSEGGHNGHAVSSFINVNRSHPLGNLSEQQVQDGIAILDRIAEKLNAMANYNDSGSDDMDNLNDMDNMNDDSQSDVQSILDSSDTSAAATTTTTTTTSSSSTAAAANMTRRTTANSRAAAASTASASTASASTATTSMTTTTRSAAAMPAPTTTSTTAMNPVPESFNELTSQFYTQIPHAFGRSIRPTVIDNQHVLQERYEALFAYVV